MPRSGQRGKVPHEKDPVAALSFNSGQMREHRKMQKRLSRVLRERQELSANREMDYHELDRECAEQRALAVRITHTLRLQLGYAHWSLGIHRQQGHEITSLPKEIHSLRHLERLKPRIERQLGAWDWLFHEG